MEVVDSGLPVDISIGIGRNDQLRKFILNAIAWTAKIEIPEGGISTPTPTEAELDAYL